MLLEDTFQSFQTNCNPQSPESQFPSNSWCWTKSLQSPKHFILQDPDILKALQAPSKPARSLNLQPQFSKVTPPLPCPHPKIVLHLIPIVFSVSKNLLRQQISHLQSCSVVVILCSNNWKPYLSIYPFPVAFILTRYPCQVLSQLICIFYHQLLSFMHHDAECKVLQMYFIQKTIEPSHTFCNNIHTYFEI